MELKWDNIVKNLKILFNNNKINLIKITKIEFIRNLDILV